MSDWHLILTRTLQEIETILYDVSVTHDNQEQHEMIVEIKKLIDEGVPCNVKPEAAK